MKEDKIIEGHIQENLIKYLKTSDEYILEGAELISRMGKLLSKYKVGDKISDEDMKLFIRSSELVVLIEITKCLEK